MSYPIMENRTVLAQLVSNLAENVLPFQVCIMYPAAEVQLCSVCDINLMELLL
jgi:hypothetical protein